MRVVRLPILQAFILQGYQPVDLFRLAEDFFVSLNMSALPPDFWTGSVLEEPVDRNVLCQASAWDFCNRQDFRCVYNVFLVSICTRTDLFFI